MTIREHLSSILELQKRYSSENTAEMNARGAIVRHELPGDLHSFSSAIADSAKLSLSDLLIEGKDGVGRKAEIPWVRIASRKFSPSATSSWYVVFLFKRDGTGVYLALAHGSTQFSGGSLVARSDAELSQLMSWARSKLPTHILSRPDITKEVRLASKGALGVAYEKSCVAALYYQESALPSDERLQEDVLTLSKLLGSLYLADELGKSPLSENPEVAAAKQAIEEIANPLTHSGQKFTLNAKDRKAIELRAMSAAHTLLTNLGFNVTDVSNFQPFDLLAERDGETYKVEVKGTTGSLGSILLTANEADLHRESWPSNALVVVHDIDLQREGTTPTCTGGVVKYWLPWRLNDSQLKPTAYSYDLSQQV